MFEIRKYYGVGMLGGYSDSTKTHIIVNSNVIHLIKILLCLIAFEMYDLFV